MQDVTKTRALEGELARTIQSMNGIKAARVHLVLPDRGSFRCDQQAASASIVISTDGPSDTSPAQAIRHLVAAAVPGLKLDNVTVLNTDGTVLASGDDHRQRLGRQDGDGRADREPGHRGQDPPHADALPRHRQFPGQRRLLASTWIAPPPARRSSTRPRASSVRCAPSRKTRWRRTPSSDAPPACRATSRTSRPAETGKNSNETNDRREELTNYEVSSKTVETDHEGYRIENLSIAVLVNKERLDAKPADGSEAMPEEHQLMDIEQLVSSAAGFSKDRGDQLKVAAVPFPNDAPTEIPQPGIMSVIMAQASGFVNSAALILVAVLVIFLGIRPAVNAIIAAKPAASSAPALPASAMASASPADPMGIETAAEVGDDNVNLIEDVTKRMNRSPQKRLEQIVEYDEEQAAAILRQWLRQDEAA